MKAVDKVFGALPDGDGEWTTVDAVVAATGLTKDTVRKHLKALKDSGRARMEDGDDGTYWRQWTDDDVVVPDEAFEVPDSGIVVLRDDVDLPDRGDGWEGLSDDGHPLQDHALEDQPAESPVEASDPDPGTDAPTEASSAASDEASAVLAGLQSARPTVTAALAEQLRPKTEACTHAGCFRTIEKRGRSWVHVDGEEFDADHRGTTRVRPTYERKGRTGNCTFRTPTGALCGLPVHTEGRTWVHDKVGGLKPQALAEHPHEATTKRQRQRSESNNVEFRKGELSDAIVAFMQGHPDTEYTPGEVTKALGAHNASSVAYAMDKLSGDGVLKATSLRPYKYRAE